jgi:predicted secreted protein
MALPGKHARVLLNGTPILGINDATFTINGEIVDVSDFESGGFRARLQNLRDAAISISGFYDPADSTGQVVLRTAVLTQALVEGLSILADAAVATSGFTCDAFVETFEISPSVEGAVPVSVSLQSHGEIEVSS